MKSTYHYLSLVLLALTLLTSCGPDANKPTPTPVPTPTPKETRNVTLFNKLDNKKYPSGSTIEYTTTLSNNNPFGYDLELFFSVLKTADYTVSLTFDKAVSGTVCIGKTCDPLKDERSYNLSAALSLVSDAEENPDPLKDKKAGDMTPLQTHIVIPAKAGETYKNRMTIQLKPTDGSETLSWTVNLAITAK